MPQVPHEQWQLVPCVQQCSKHVLSSPVYDYLNRSYSSLGGKSQSIIIYPLVIVFVAMSFPACSLVNGLWVRKQKVGSDLENVYDSDLAIGFATKRKLSETTGFGVRKHRFCELEQAPFISTNDGPLICEGRPTSHRSCEDYMKSSKV